MTVWRPTDGTKVVLYKYHIFSMVWKDGTKTKHICGETEEGEGRVSSPILEFIDAKTVRTKSRTYFGINLGTTSNSIYVKNRWLAFNSKHGEEVEDA